MKASVCVLLIGVCLAPTIQLQALPASCGNPDARFKVTADAPGPLPQTASREAQLIFLETVDAQGPFVGTGVIARIGIDGSWIGAAKGNSYLAYSVAPGEHHLCANWPGGDDPEWQRTAVTSVNLEQGKVYYFRIRIAQKQYFVGSTIHTTDHVLDLIPLNEDEGKYLAGLLARANARLVK
jgi:hypothetical protein